MEGSPLPVGQFTPATVLCSNCGRPIDGTSGLVMCTDCIRLHCKVADHIPREGTIHFCRNCERFLMPPATWVGVQPESRELLALLLKRLSGLNRVRLVDAGFLWTEPHSRRIRIKVAVQGEGAPGVIVQEQFEVEFVVVATQCPDCARSYTVHTWRACVQLRQKVGHKRTFLYLEQLILKHNAHLETVSIQESRDGIDFFYAHPQHALKMIDFLSRVSPIRSKRSEQLISQDTHTGQSQYKFTYSVEIAPICREDLVVLPRDLAQKLGSLSQIVICTRVTQSLQFLDPNTLQTAELPGSVYWHQPCTRLAGPDMLTEFVVLDCEALGPMRGKWVLSDVSVARSSNMSQQFLVRSHLGALLHPGDLVLGYFLQASNFNSDLWDSLIDKPDVILVKKSYQRTRRQRNWKLKRMAKEYNENVDTQQIDKVEHDYEVFLQELEEDRELRQTINLYKQEGAIPAATDDNSGPVIDVSELLDDMEGLSIDR